MVTVPRYGPYSPVTTQPTPTAQLGNGNAKIMASVVGVFDKARQFVAPAAQYEQQIIGEKQALAEINAGTFKTRTPYTVRSASFQNAADRIITGRTMDALTTSMSGAIKSANGNPQVLAAELQKIQTDIGGSLPDLPGLAIDFAESFRRSSAVAKRRTAAIASARVVAQHKQEAKILLSSVSESVNNLALQGGTPDELQAQVAQAQKLLANYGPQAAFEIGGVKYPADPKRAGMFTPGQISGKIEKLSTDASKVMLEASFQQSENPSSVVQKFRADVFSGKSPLPPAESLKLLARYDARAYTVETRRKAEAAKVQSELEKSAKARATATKDAFSQAETTVSALTKMAENGALEMLPADQIDAMRTAVQHDPALARKLEAEIAVAQAAIDTNGATNAQLKTYAAGRTAEMAKMAKSGAVDYNGVAVLEYLSPALKTLRDAVSSESLGIPSIQSGILKGTVDNVNFANLRKQAAGNKSLLLQIDTTERLLLGVQSLGELSPKKRQETIDQIDTSIAKQAAMADGFGRDAVLASKAMPDIVKWSDNLKAVAGADVMKYADMRGIKLAGFQDAKTLADLGAVIVDRVDTMQPVVAAEGVATAGLPLRKPEISAISDAFKASTTTEQVAFLGEIAAMDKAQASQLFSAMGGDAPAMSTAGQIYMKGNTEAATTILRGGSADIKMPAPNVAEITTSRIDGLGDALQQGWFSGETLKRVDYAAMAYAKGRAIAEGSDAISTDNLDQGYQIALGRQADGSGGLQSVDAYWGGIFGSSYQTILPAGWTGLGFENLLKSPAMEGWIKTHPVLMSSGQPFQGQEFYQTIGGMLPTGDTTFIPVDSTGKFFQAKDGNPYQIDLNDFKGFK